jgi:hypothetical protein
MSEANAKNHANFACAFIMTGRAIKIDKRLPYFFFKKSFGSMPACLRIALNVPSGISPG